MPNVLLHNSKYPRGLNYKSTTKKSLAQLSKACQLYRLLFKRIIKEGPRRKLSRSSATKKQQSLPPVLLLLFVQLYHFRVSLRSTIIFGLIIAGIVLCEYEELKSKEALRNKI